MNRQALLEAALGVFREMGYAAASVDAVAEAAGFTKGAVYSHFDSKADLFLSLLEHRIAERARQQHEWVTGPIAAADVVGVVRRVFAASDRDPAWRLAQMEFRVVAARDRALNARYAQVHRETAAGIVATLERLCDAAGVEPSRPLDELARIGLAMDAGRFLEERTEPASWTADQAADVFCELAGLPRPGRLQRTSKEG